MKAEQSPNVPELSHGESGFRTVHFKSAGYFNEATDAVR